MRSATLLVLVIMLSMTSVVMASEIGKESSINPGLTTAVIERTLTYQGILKDNAGDPVGDGNYNLTFRIYDAASDGILIWTSPITPIATSGGYFSAILGPIQLPFDIPYYLSIQVQGDSEMGQRQKMTLAPYSAVSDTANYAFAAPGSSNWYLNGNVLYSNGFWGLSRGSAVDSLYGDSTHTMINLGAFSIAGDPTATKKYGTIGGGIENRATGNYSTVSGGNSNTAYGDHSAVCGGGGNTSLEYGFVGGGIGNIVGESYGVIGGGNGNFVNSQNSVIAGGADNAVFANAAAIVGGANNQARGIVSFVGGGSENFAQGFGSTIVGGGNNSTLRDYSFVGGGESNWTDGYVTSIVGGHNNIAGDNVADTAAFIGGGWVNRAYGKYSTVTGGSNNTAQGNHSFIGGGVGNYAAAVYSVVCGGNSNSNYGGYSTILGGYADTLDTSGDYSLIFGNNVYNNNDYRAIFFDGINYGSLNVNRDGRDGTVNTHPIQVGTSASNGNGAYLTAGGVWTNGSSRTFKENFTPFNGEELLSKISNLSVTTYNYKNSQEKHVGPVAEEFVGAFDVGAIREEDGKRDDMYLSAGDVAGVALAGVQELLKEIERLEKRIAELEKR